MKLLFIGRERKNPAGAWGGGKIGLSPFYSSHIAPSFPYGKLV